MKYYKDENNQVYAYEDDLPEFGSYTEVEIVNDNGETVIEKVYPKITVKEGLIAITENEANELIATLHQQSQIDVDKIVPQSLSRFQAITVLKLTKLEDGQTLYQATEDYINSLPDNTIENITAKTAWENAQVFKRDSALIKMAQTMFQLTDEQVDQMFINGEKIEA